MNEKEYYKMMCSFSTEMKFKEIHEKWYKCFSYILKSFNVNYTDTAIKSLFYDFDMDNWKAMWKENTEYADYSNEQLIKEFCGETSYISDRTSYDRLFRTHWFFRNAFREKLIKIRFPSTYNE
jgi:hypothetical protein